jgi:anti-anti-sigma factor
LAEEQVMALKVTVTQDRTFSKTVHLDGRLDTETVTILDDELSKLADAPVDVVVFDLAGLEYISSAGLRSIFAMRQTLAARSGRIVLLNARPQVQKVFDIVKAADLAAIFTSVEELDRYLDAMQRKVVDGR